MIQSSKEELVNSFSHGLGALIGILFLPFLCIDLYYSDIEFIKLAVILYGFSFVFLFLSSTIYHSIKKQEIKKHLQKVDHISIYFMIAGTYTPFIFACLEGFSQWLFFGIMWGIVLVGTIFKLYFTGKFEKLSLIFYLGMGWMLVFMIHPFYSYFDFKIIGLVIAGGIAYTGGVYYYANDKKKYYHFVWHLFVLAGALFHLSAIIQVR